MARLLLRNTIRVKQLNGDLDLSIVQYSIL